jgi:hypothetical protein
VHQSFFEVQGKKLGRKVMELFTEASAYQSKDLGNGHSILDMAPKRKSHRPVNNILRGSTSKASNDLYLESLVRHYGEERTSEILGASNVNLAVFPNLLIIGIQFRNVIPISVNRTDVYLTPTTLKECLKRSTSRGCGHMKRSMVQRAAAHRTTSRCLTVAQPDCGLKAPNGSNYHVE